MAAGKAIRQQFAQLRQRRLPLCQRPLFVGKNPVQAEKPHASRMRIHLKQPPLGRLRLRGRRGRKSLFPQLSHKSKYVGRERHAEIHGIASRLLAREQPMRHPVRLPHPDSVRYDHRRVQA